MLFGMYWLHKRKSLGLTKIYALMGSASAAVGSSTMVNASRMSLKQLRTQPHIVENLGITMAPLFLSLTS